MKAFDWTPELAQAFTDHFVIVRGKSKSAAEKYCRCARMFFTFACSDNNPSGVLDRSCVEGWLKHLAVVQKNRSNATRASRLSAVRSVCKWLVDEGILPTNPCAGIPTPKVRTTAAQKFSSSELTKLFSPVDKSNISTLRDRVILMLFYATGIRREEMSNMSIHRTTLGERTGRLQIIGKGAKMRTVAFEGAVVPLIKLWLVGRAQYALADEDALFISLHGKGAGKHMSIRSLHDVIKRVSKRVGIRDSDAFLHKLRSTFATDLYDQGIEIAEIAILMGHASIDTTRRYIAISERHLNKSRIPTSRWQELGVNHG